MATITAAEFKTLISDSGLPTATAEIIIDQAINCLNWLGNLELSNLGGTSPNKTVSVESKEKGAIYFVARAVYESFYKGAETVGLPGLTATPSDLMSNLAVLQTVREAARHLTEMDVSRG